MKLISVLLTLITLFFSNASHADDIAKSNKDSFSEMMAKNQLVISKQISTIEGTQQYFQEDKIWKQDLLRIKNLANNGNKEGGYVNHPFFYLTNNDSKRLIKGSIELGRYTSRGNPSAIYHTGLHHFSLKDNLLHFVILPNQSVLLGRWAKWLPMKIIEADFLSAEEVEQLKAEHGNTNTETPEALEKVGVIVKIYALSDNDSDNDFTKIIENDTPEYSPGLIVEAGKTAEIAISNSKNQHELEKLKIKLSIDKTATKYDIDFELHQGEANSISGMTDIEVGDDLLFTAKLNDTTKLVKVKTLQVEGSLSEMMAKNQLVVSQHLTTFEGTQQYFQEDKIWQQDQRRLKNLANNGDRSQTSSKDHFFYLTNNDSKRLIKGTVELIGGNKGNDVKTEIFNTGIHFFSLKDNLLHFVILPSQSVLLGRWGRSLKIELVEADFLSVEEVEQLKANQNSNQ
ncbi:MAG: hypothetical protein MJK12_06865 [Colwellia sp.]|nr:hypothetical protein [Colwellia sp.]